MIFGCQTSYMFAGIERDDEHEAIIEDIESKLFPRDEIKPQRQHSELMLTSFEEEMRFLEEWLIRDIYDEYCIQFADLVQTGFKEQIKVPNNGMNEEEMQQSMKSNSKKIETRTKLDDEVEKLWMLVKRMSKK
jgi:hypothetical protein